MFKNAMKLQDLQHDFFARISARDVPSGRMEVYRTNYYEGLTAVLKGVYPTVEALVGEQFFYHMVQIFIEKHVPHSVNMDAYGEELAAFIDGFEHAGTVPYLADVARLDWLFHCAELAPYAPVADSAQFSDIPPQQYEHVRLKIHPSVMLFESRFPVASIYRMAQGEQGEEGEELLDLSVAQGERVVVVRPFLKTQIVPLKSVEYVFLKTLIKTQTLPPSFEAAMAEDETFDFAHAMRRVIDYGVFCGFIA